MMPFGEPFNRVGTAGKNKITFKEEQEEHEGRVGRCTNVRSLQKKNVSKLLLTTIRLKLFIFFSNNLGNFYPKT